MTLFGRTLGGEEIASLVFLLMVLVLWIGAWRQDRNWTRWFRERKERRDAERAGETGGDKASPASDVRRGPWG